MNWITGEQAVREEGVREGEKEGVRERELLEEEQHKKGQPWREKGRQKREKEQTTLQSRERLSRGI